MTGKSIIDTHLGWLVGLLRKPVPIKPEQDRLLAMCGVTTQTFIALANERNGVRSIIGTELIKPGAGAGRVVQVPLHDASLMVCPFCEAGGGCRVCPCDRGKGIVVCLGNDRDGANYCACLEYGVRPPPRIVSQVTASGHTAKPGDLSVGGPKLLAGPRR